MGSISSGMAPLPAGAGSAGAAAGGTQPGTYGALSRGAVERLRGDGIPDDLIGVADGMVAARRAPQVGPAGSLITSANPTPSAPSAPRALTPEQQQFGAAAASGALDVPDKRYPGLLEIHALILAKIGTPPQRISEISSWGITHGEMDRYIQAEIMQNPEGWDRFVNSPRGTARRGLQEVFPNISLPAPVAGTTAPAPIPGTAPAPGGVAAGGGLPDWVPPAAVIAGLGGAGYGMWRLGKGHATKHLLGAKEVAEAGAPAVRVGATAAGGGPSASALRGAAAQAAAGAGGIGAGSPAMLDAMARGLLPGHEAAMQYMNAFVNHGLPAREGAKWGLAHSLFNNPAMPSLMEGAAKGAYTDEVAAAIKGLTKLL